MKVSQIIRLNEGLAVLVKMKKMTNNEREEILGRCGLIKDDKDNNVWILDEHIIINMNDE
tara:strand:- start:269 stop:448 length:180 start_codon:yes stop_codon:yes gene_type:complete